MPKIVKKLQILVKSKILVICPVIIKFAFLFVDGKRIYVCAGGRTVREEKTHAVSEAFKCAAPVFADARNLGIMQE